MKNCPKCNAQMEDNEMFCKNCGTSYAQPQQPQQPQAPQPQNVVMPVDPTDHTSEFSAKEVSDNKLFALLIYVFDLVGVVIALLASINNKSDYLKFHIKQGLKFTITEVVIAVISAVLCWTCIVPVAAGVCYIILLIAKIICFCKTASNKSCEPIIISSLGFLK